MISFSSFEELVNASTSKAGFNTKVELPLKEGVSYKFADKPDNTLNLVILDVETTGLSYERDEIIELAAVGMQICADTYKVVSIGSLFDFFQEPDKPISAKITEITGIKQEDVKGQKINFSEVRKWLDKADLVIAHNASFDRPFVDRLPLDWDEINLRWACSCHDANWPKYRYPNRKLGDILNAAGFKFDAHRAINDCLATAFALAYHPDELKAVVDMGMNDTYRVMVSKTPYGSNDLVKSKGFAFNGNGWAKYFLDMDEMVEVRTRIAEEMKEGYGRVPNIAIKQFSPFSRFAAGT